MNTICQFIEIIHKRNCKFIGTDAIPKDGFNFKPLSGVGKIDFPSTGKRKNGNVYYQQKLSFTYRYENITELSEYSGAHLIVKIHKPDGSVFTWGRLDNPVQVDINTKDGFAKFSFFRESAFPEY